MEKKLAFRLNFIKNKLSDNFEDKKKSKKKRKALQLKTALQEIMEKSCVVERFIDPILCHRTNGDMIFFDNLDSRIDYISYPKLRNSFQKISLIQLSEKFLTAFYEANDDPFRSDIKLLIERLNSQGDRNAHEFAQELGNIDGKLRNLDFAIKNKYSSNEIPDDDNSSVLKEIYKLHEEDPIFSFYYTKSANIGLKIYKYGINDVSKYLTMRDDIKVFENSVLLSPFKDYYSYTKEMMEFFFNDEKTQIFFYYLNTIQGIKKCFCKSYTLWLNTDGCIEKIMIITFPKELQTPDVQNLYESINEQIKKDVETNGDGIGKKRTISNMNEWKELMKKYYRPMLKKEYRDGEKFRCKYKILEPPKPEKERHFSN